MSNIAKYTQRYDVQMTAAQCKGARAMLGLTRKDLAKSAKVAERTLVNFEGEKRNLYDRTLIDIQKALENAGIVFIPEDKNGGAGIRLSQTGPTEKADKKQIETT